MARYDEVIATLDLSREFIAAFDKIAVETSKEEKKRKKREIFEKQQFELSRFKELFTIQVSRYWISMTTYKLLSTC